MRSANLQPSRTRLVDENQSAIKQRITEEAAVFSIGLWRSFEEGQVGLKTNALLTVYRLDRAVETMRWRSFILTLSELGPFI